MASKRLPELDLLRAVALIGVGVIHGGAWVTPAEAPPGQNAMAAASGLARFCVPAFVFASGFVLMHTYADRRRDPGAFLRRRWARVLVPWAWCVPLFLLLDVRRGDPPLTAVGIGRWLAYGPGHLYFLVLMAQLYVVFLLLPRGRKLGWAALGLVLVQLALTAWRTYGRLPGEPLAWPGVFASPEEAPFWAGTFALGCLAGAEWPRLRRLDGWWPVAALGSIATAALVLLEGRFVQPGGGLREGSGAYFWPSHLAQTIAWCMALLWIGCRFQARLEALWSPVRQLSQHSLGIYLLHPAILDVLGPRTSQLPPALRVPALIALSFAAAYLAVRLLALTPLTASIVGEQAPPATTKRRLTLSFT
ncbi:MAG TPA: acyltransferase [Chloroflexota bacterium]|nr:acyltransferase [Chloroflexota bacterium]